MTHVTGAQKLLPRAHAAKRKTPQRRVWPCGVSTPQRHRAAPPCTRQVERAGLFPASPLRCRGDLASNATTCRLDIRLSNAPRALGEACSAFRAARIARGATARGVLLDGRGA